MATDKRAQRIWLRLIQAYGSRVAESYGEDMPRPWSDAVADLTDEQVAYGLRKVTRDTPIHPPTLGQFVACCIDMPQVAKNDGPTIQERLSEYVMIQMFSRMHPRQVSMPWTYIYREWNDEEKPKHAQRQAECTGVYIPAFGDFEGFRIDVIDMTGDRTYQMRLPPSRTPKLKLVQIPDLTK